MTPSRDQIVDAAMTLAEETDWESVRLQDVARRLGCPLHALSVHFREKEELADAWFDRADQAMLQAAADPALASLPVESRLEHLLFCWLDAMQAHHRVTRQMILGKLEPGHLHVQLPSVLRISRTVQWLREAADCNASGLRRALEETALTTLFVSASHSGCATPKPGQSKRERCSAAASVASTGASAGRPHHARRPYHRDRCPSRMP